MRLIVTGGAGFIGSNFVRRWAKAHPADEIVVIDAITYAGDWSKIEGTGARGELLDITDGDGVNEVFGKVSPDVVVHFAAETHVDRSIRNAAQFVHTNVLGTQMLLQAARGHEVRRFIHVSTDEVYGSLGPHDPPFTEEHPLLPNSPYAASKAGADCMARAYFKTHGLPVIITRCSNNYGPGQYPEKLIPVLIMKALAGEMLPIYGDGRNSRDWIHVDDHCAALELLIEKGTPGEAYNVGANCEWTNRTLALVIGLNSGRTDDLIEYVKDRPGHDLRYAVDASKLRKLGWAPGAPLGDRLPEVMEWYRGQM